LSTPASVGTPSGVGRSAIRVWEVGDDVDTDQLAPGQYMKFGIEVIAAHCLELSLPEFARSASAGDYLIAGVNFGCGSSREQAPAALVHRGIQAVVARSFAGLFYRNAFNLGLLLLQTGEPRRLLGRQVIQIDAAAGRIQADNEVIECEPIPSFLLDYVAAGGLLPYLKSRSRTGSKS
jgi:3-isopropylmalate/(R)-2-methylmalate dehydratase small subunit